MTLSVVITSRNNARTIGRCLDSLVLYYRRGDITEIVLVDGHSTDGTVEIARSYPLRLLPEDGTEGYKDSIIRGFYGVHHGRDQGWRNACGDLVMFMDGDAYLAEDFFPQALAFFADEKLGVLGCWAKAWVTTRLTETIGQLWSFHGERIRAIQSNSLLHQPFERLYRLVTTFGAKRLLASGPCYIVRRSCLELLGGHDMLGDVGISLRLQDRGWRSWWWVDAPVYHLPKESLKELSRQRCFWGLVGAYMPVGAGPFVFHAFIFSEKVERFKIFLAIRFRTAWHLAALPLTEVSHFSGYLRGLQARARGTR